jgi:hypothetical protein
VTSRPNVLAKGLSRFLTAVNASVVFLALTGGCQNDGELANRAGAGAMLAPQSVEDYARRRNITTDQARRELQEAQSKRDADQAIQNIDDVGVKRQ